jgi:hypothetical protein
MIDNPRSGSDSGRGVVHVIDGYSYGYTEVRAVLGLSLVLRNLQSYFVIPFQPDPDSRNTPDSAMLTTIMSRIVPPLRSGCTPLSPSENNGRSVCGRLPRGSRWCMVWGQSDDRKPMRPMQLLSREDMVDDGNGVRGIMEP